MPSSNDVDPDDTEKDFDVLPVIEFKSLIIKSTKENQIFICISETGSGKTTQIPQFCLDGGLLGATGMIAITQPRRVAAITVAHRVSEERKGKVGETVGYSVRFDDQTSSKTRIKYMTDGILLRECLSDPLLSKYNIVMLDEAHERSINTDILFGLVKGVCLKRSDLRVIVTSATLDVEKFSHYFNACPIVRIPGRVFPVDIYHSKLRQVMTASGPASSGYVNAAVESVLNIHRQDEEGHILVFLTGQEEVEKACALIREALRENHNNSDNTDGGNSGSVEELVGRELVPFPLYAALPNELQKLVFKKLEPKTNFHSSSSSASSVHRSTNNLITAATETTLINNMKHPRKCIVATNIAETSITVPNVRFVVDCGYTKQKTFDPARSMESLVVVPISQVSSDQRAGRAGRTAPGACYRLYSSDCYNNMMPETVPEILRSNLASTVLYLKALGIVDCLCFDFIEPPAADQVMEALLQLHMLSAIDSQGEITHDGQLMSRLPLDPVVAKMIVTSATKECDCVSAAVSIAAMLSTESVFVRPFKPTKQGQSQSYQNNNSSSSNTSSKALTKNKRGQIQLPNRSWGTSSSITEAESTSSSNNNSSSSVDARCELAHSRLCHPLGDHLTYLHIFRTFSLLGSSSSSSSSSSDGGNKGYERSKDNDGGNNRDTTSNNSSSYSKSSSSSMSLSSYERDELQKSWCRDNFINYRSMKNAVRIREQLWSEVQSMKLTNSSSSNSSSNSSSHIKSKLSEDVRVCQAVASSLYMKAARVCAGNDTVYRSLPFTHTHTTTHTTSGSSSSSGNIAHTNDSNSGMAADWSQVSTFMTAEVMLLHPQSTSAVALSTHRPPEYVVFQDLVFGGRASMRHVCAVDGATLTALRAAYKPASPLALSGRQVLPITTAASVVVIESVVEVKSTTADSHGGIKRPRRQEDDMSSSNTKKSMTQNNVAAASSCSTVTANNCAITSSAQTTTANTTTSSSYSSSQSAAEAARQRFLARKGRAV